MDSLSTIIVAANTLTLVFGGVITGLAYRAYRRTDSSALRALSIGLGFVTLGTLLGGSLHQLLDVELLTSVAVQSVFTALGFTILAYSLLADHRPDPERERSLSISK